MNKMLSVIAVAIFLTYPLGGAAATAQDDAGSGGDAPDGYPGLAVGPGQFSGVLDVPAGDSGDAYFVNASTGPVLLDVAGAGLQVRVQTMSVDLVLDTPVHVRLEAPARFMVHADQNETITESLEYAFEIARVPLPDFRIVSLAVEPVLLSTPAGPVEHPGAKMVVVTVENVGEASGPVAVGVTVENNPSLSGSRMGRGIDDLDVGETKTLRLRWSTLGAVGTVNLHAVAVGRDSDDSNDAMDLAVTFVAAPPGGFGYDPAML